MLRRQFGLCGKFRLQHQLSLAARFVFASVALHSTSAVNGSTHLRQQHARFRCLLQELQGTSACDVSGRGSRNRRGGGSTSEDAAIPSDEPLVANIALMERLGVMDLVQRCASNDCVTLPASTDGNSRLAPQLFAATGIMTEACKAGVACHLSPVVVLQKVMAASRQSCGNDGVCLPLTAVTVLLSSSAERITAKAEVLRRCIDGRDAMPIRNEHATLPWSDQGESGRLRWALAEEKRRGYELLRHLPLRPLSKKADYEKGMQVEVTCELRARIGLAVALQDGAVATAALGELMALYTQHLNGSKNSDNNKNYTWIDENSGYYFSEVAHGAEGAISALRFSRDFETAWSIWEEFNAVMPKGCIMAFGNKNINRSNDSNSGGGEEATSATKCAAEKFRLLTALAECIDTDVAHFTRVRDAVMQLFATTDVGYFKSTRSVSRNVICTVLHALSRVSLEPRAKMEAAENFFSAVQRTSHADVCDSASITEVLLQVASVAQDNNVALLLYNRLADPKVHRAEVPANIAAMLVAERDALSDVARFFSFLKLGRRVITSTAVHLLVAKLLLQQHDGARSPSEVMYTLLDLIDMKREVEPQRTFFLRLLVFHRDLVVGEQERQLGGGASGSMEVQMPHTQRILQSWSDELRATGITTCAYTTLALLQRLHHLLELSPLLPCIDALLSEFSLGWLRHRAAASRTTGFHLPTSRLQQLMDEASTSGVALKTLCHAPLRVPMSLPFSLPHTIAASSPEPEVCLAAVKKTYDALCKAAGEGSVVVLGFSDYLRFCALEDAGQMCGSAQCATSPLLYGEFCFSLDNLNLREPPVYVTDALGELVLQEEREKNGGDAATLRCTIPVDEVLVDPVRCRTSDRNNTHEREWLSRWLEESILSSHPVCGVFERHLEHLLRATLLGLEALDKTDESELLSCFVSLREAEPIEC